jgi:hypothetical protein
MAVSEFSMYCVRYTESLVRLMKGISTWMPGYLGYLISKVLLSCLPACLVALMPEGSYR